MIERGEAVALASFLHVRELPAIEMELIDIAPVVGGGIHGEARGDGAVGANDDVILAGAAVPFAEAQVTIGALNDAGHGGEHARGLAVGSRSIAIPAILSQIQA